MTVGGCTSENVGTRVNCCLVIVRFMGVRVKLYEQLSCRHASESVGGHMSELD